MYVLICVGGSLFYLSLDIDRYRWIPIDKSIDKSIGGWVYVWVCGFKKAHHLCVTVQKARLHDLFDFSSFESALNPVPSLLPGEG